MGLLQPPSTAGGELRMALSSRREVELPKRSKPEIALPFREIPEPIQRNFHQQLGVVLRSLDTTYARLARSLKVTSRTLSYWNVDAASHRVQRYIDSLKREPKWRDSMGEELRRFAALHRESPGDLIQPNASSAATTSGTSGTSGMPAAPAGVSPFCPSAFQRHKPSPSTATPPC